jgi:Mlc titration factor MtfA (ptsG expression regulator)
MLEAFIITVGVACVCFWWLKGRQRKARRTACLATPLPDEARQILVRTSPIYSRLPTEFRERLEGYIQVFMAETNFEGCGGQEITDEVRITIAAQACILLLGRERPVYPKLRTVLVYPHTYVAGGEGGGARLGESWESGVVVLSWNSVKGGAANIHDGHNVTVHEFAHQLDQEDGSADGTPTLDSSTAYHSWVSHLSTEYADFLERVDSHRKTVVDQYGATNPAEFFATATEAFLEKPRQLQRRRPELYEELKAYYRMDPLTWEA